LFVNPLDLSGISPSYPGPRWARNRRGSDRRHAFALVMYEPAIVGRVLVSVWSPIGIPAWGDVL
jgi:hypothetical protein